MYHPKRQGKMEGLLELKPGRIYLVESNSRQHPGTLCTPLHSGKHLWLEVGSDYRSGGTYKPGHGDCEVSVPASHIKTRVTGLDEPLKELVRVVE